MRRRADQQPAGTTRGRAARGCLSSRMSGGWNGRRAGKGAGKGTMGLASRLVAPAPMGIDVHLGATTVRRPKCISGPMPTPGRPSDPHGMATRTAMRQRSASATNLYDGACDLLYAAQQMRVAAAERGATPALAATVGCMDAALDALADAVGAMRREALAELGLGRVDSPTAMAAVDREFAALVDVLRAAQAACDRTRERTGPLLAQLTLA
jgi:hypothetical protein